jgi:hypothetical protein
MSQNPNKERFAFEREEPHLHIQFKVLGGWALAECTPNNGIAAIYTAALVALLFGRQHGQCRHECVVGTNHGYGLVFYARG